jgi:hypothetical protein
MRGPFVRPSLLGSDRPPQQLTGDGPQDPLAYTRDRGPPSLWACGAMQLTRRPQAGDARRARLEGRGSSSRNAR